MGLMHGKHTEIFLEPINGDSNGDQVHGIYTYVGDLK